MNSYKDLGERLKGFKRINFLYLIIMQALAQFITRPQRQRYDDSDLRNFRFEINGKSFTRQPLELNGKRGNIVASWYFEVDGKEDKCIVYCHGKSGCQTDCEE